MLELTIHIHFFYNNIHHYQSPIIYFYVFSSYHFLTNQFLNSSQVDLLVVIFI